jgi:hypothetical protein
MWGVLTKRGLEELKGRVATLEGEDIHRNCGRDCG